VPKKHGKAAKIPLRWLTTADANRKSTGPEAYIGANDWAHVVPAQKISDKLDKLDTGRHPRPAQQHRKRQTRPHSGCSDYRLTNGYWFRCFEETSLYPITEVNSAAATRFAQPPSLPVAMPYTVNTHSAAQGVQKEWCERASIHTSMPVSPNLRGTTGRALAVPGSKNDKCQQYNHKNVRSQTASITY